MVNPSTGPAVNQPETVSDSERNEFYEGCLRNCGNCKGWLNTWVCICNDSPYKKIPEGNFGVIQEFGVFLKIVPPGFQYINPSTQTLVLVDRREKTVDLRKQNLLTKDNVTVLIDAVIYYKVLNPYRSQFEIENLDFAIKEIARTTLKDVMGNTLLQEAFENREHMAIQIRDFIDRPAISWGVDVTRVLLQEIILSMDLQTQLSTAATTKRSAEGKIIMAQADVDSAKLMREASDILNTPAAMQIRYLDAITGLAQAANTKVVFMPPSSGKDSSTDIKTVKRFLIQNELN
jgi:erythrocyte band 7 integral membrane protein